MKKVTVECWCESCNKEMTEDEYDQGVDIRLTAYVPSPDYRASEVGGATLKICDSCAEEIGIVKYTIHKGMGAKTRINNAVEKNKAPIYKMFLKLFFKKEEADNE